MKSIIIKITAMFVFTLAIYGITTRKNQITSSSQQKFINLPCRIIINFDNNIVFNGNQIIALDFVKSEDLQKVLHTKIYRL